VSSYQDSRIYGQEQIANLLRAIDRHLTEPAKMIIIGGGAVALHGAESTTNDIDTYNAVSAALQASIDQAVAETGLDLSVGQTTVGDYPWDFEDRLERQLPELLNLEVYILEKHDLALSKATRGNKHDEDQLMALHGVAPLDFDTLVGRFKREMTHVTGNPDTIRENFLQLVERVFGEIGHVAAEKALR
jgi:hypothetical protein